MTEIACPRCAAPSKATQRFCAECGWEMAKPYLRRSLQSKHLMGLVLCGALLFGVGWTMQSNLAGKKPTQAFQSQEPELSSDPELVKLRQAAEAQPENKVGWRTFASALADKISASEKVEPAVIFEAIGVLRKILDLDPQDTLALVGMADISFSQQAFSKAAEFYKRYLDVVPDDDAARARYGSSLTFMGKHEESIAELTKALKQNPKSFHASAYLAVTYAEAGDMTKAREFGKQSLDLAPSPEAKARMQEFLDSLKAKNDSAKPASDVKTQPAAGQGRTVAPPGEAKPILEYLEQHQIAGQKFAGAEFNKNGELLLKFKNFPMDQMPPFVREKFLGSIKEKLGAISDKSIKAAVFVDADSGAEMARVTR